MNGESPQPPLIDGVPGGAPVTEESAVNANAEQQLIDSVPGVEPQEPSATTTQATVKGETFNSTNRVSAPVLGLPEGMTNEQAHVLARQQNQAK